MCEFDPITSLLNQVNEIAPEENSVDFIDATSGGLFA